MTQTKRIFITGTSSGLGKAAAQRFAHEGWHVIASMRQPSEEAELTKIKGIDLMPLDVSDPAAITEAAARTLKEFGPSTCSSTTRATVSPLPWRPPKTSNSFVRSTPTCWA